MQLEIYSPTNGQILPQNIEWNFEELNAWLDEGIASYKGRVYDETQIAEAKKDRAMLNKLADAIDGERKRIKARYMEPVNKMGDQAKVLLDKIYLMRDIPDAQIKAFENFKRQEKQAEIEKVYASLIGDLAELVPYERLHNPKWLNVTYSMTNISEDLARSIGKIEAGMAAINKLDISPEIAKQVKTAFLKNYDLAAALAEKERIEKQQAELARYESAREAAHAAPPVEGKYTPTETVEPVTEPRGAAGEGEAIHTVTFRVHVTAAQLKALGDFMKEHGIKPERV